MTWRKNKRDVRLNKVHKQWEASNWNGVHWKTQNWVWWENRKHVRKQSLFEKLLSSGICRAMRSPWKEELFSLTWGIGHGQTKPKKRKKENFLCTLLTQQTHRTKQERERESWRCSWVARWGREREREILANILMGKLDLSDV